MKITEKHFDIVTQEETIVERDETAAETKARLDSAKAYELLQAESEAKAAARAAAEAKLATLGLTADEVAALLG
jgi:hypothetical protein